ncbi:DUF4389 domain-containing protein [Amycolatopsis decaplanina]|uniref:Transmembrane protein n=1 Tax=Amycolatopsis decaplanina DSM 44594 TaxID=1284240 RepID=M2X219_9PSEU|nr:DUF4389 domain-containing protein [Amycolatopsis decaplanina]EME55061.1 hypothetical protein H074_26172 [Amycolatopsis decaplanina DSM 44594]
MSSAVRVEASLDPDLSRWLWLVKWLLAIPHYLVLAVLWLAFVPLTVVAFFAILFTGRYPRAIFEFDVGVLRWTWRVQYYTYAALGTDQYPPFTLADDPGYPARLEIDYPERLSRGLVLVKWWLLALPHYLLVGLFAGGGLWLWNTSDDGFRWGAGGLIGILVLIAAVILLVRGEYPKPIFDFVLGLDRWVIRVGAYAALMTDDYPPFRLDPGGTEPGPPAEGPAEPERNRPAGAGWTSGRIVSVVAGVVLVVLSTGLLTGGGTLLWLDRAVRDDDGYLTVSGTYRTDTYALVSERVRFAAADGVPATRALGDVRVRVTDLGAGDVFVGVAPTSAAERYLAGAGYATVTDLSSGELTVHPSPGSPVLPWEAGIWTVSAAGTGTQTISWPDQAGDWTLVVMNTDGSAGVDVRAEAGATFPILGPLSWVLLLSGALLLAAGVALAAVAVTRVSKEFSPNR